MYKENKKAINNIVFNIFLPLLNFNCMRHLERLQESVSPACYNDIINLIEGLFMDDGRPDLIDNISKTLTGKTPKQHLEHKLEKVAKRVVKKLTPKPQATP